MFLTFQIVSCKIDSVRKIPVNKNANKGESTMARNIFTPLDNVRITHNGIVRSGIVIGAIFSPGFDKDSRIQQVRVKLNLSRNPVLPEETEKDRVFWTTSNSLMYNTIADRFPNSIYNTI
ncbi:MAG: hypothetical protein NUV65_06880 [Candidatus Roizmanbacteria bacterium]|nr:hypothetical protein [Candidatus Roizmanbacteria bacterium]